jgi:membrane protein involved in colicin uptake
VHNPFGDDAPLNRFILISVILHAILFFALPDLSSIFDVDTPGLAGGGVIQVMHVETTM